MSNIISTGGSDGFVSQPPPPPRVPLPGAQPSLAPPGDAPVIAFHDVWRYWGRRSKRWAVLKGVELEARAGTSTCIRGGNGVGKTTLLRIATGILAPHAGSVTIDGIPGEGNWREYHRHVGFLSAGDRGLYPRLSVRGHLEYVARISFIPPARRQDAISEVANDFALTDLLDRRSDRMSQGQRQRLRLALTFMHRPKVLLLDEPRNSLDMDGLRLLTAAVEQALARGAALIWVAPLGEDQPLQFDRSLVIQDGTLSPEEP